ncbi:hypothetical protein SARC_05355 [Sphaeroforma arctica JP610]|uniref:Uncharacterized protein n=1 Tax=Sphaeroforma arctica JP610 TaxID=667725 RepID=A0A0L0FZS6_9EUKA|nr:hypothetical protein SARC_05355 [Sphaeroforma arctica JP610]KNC82362.1 hypothetical protein SARC_05355 [Sphaeroforma arctica JP610]|eukprot:XP_014156264.1 hypothetical protein SARC_05355 [Sphaeroforma arctica JP610]
MTVGVGSGTDVLEEHRVDEGFSNRVDEDATTFGVSSHVWSAADSRVVALRMETVENAIMLQLYAKHDDSVAGISVVLKLRAFVGVFVFGVFSDRSSRPGWGDVILFSESHGSTASVRIRIAAIFLKGRLKKNFSVSEFDKEIVLASLSVSEFGEGSIQASFKDVYFAEVTCVEIVSLIKLILSIDGLLLVVCGVSEGLVILCLETVGGGTRDN